MDDLSSALEQPRVNDYDYFPKNNVFCHKSATIHHSANILSSIVGPNTHIGRSCTVKSSSISSNVIINSNVTISNSIIYSDCIIEDRSICLTSILAKFSRLCSKSFISSGVLIGPGVKLEGNSVLTSSRLICTGNVEARFSDSAYFYRHYRNEGNCTSKWGVSRAIVDNSDDLESFSPENDENFISEAHETISRYLGSKASGVDNLIIELNSLKLICNLSISQLQECVIVLFLKFVNQDEKLFFSDLSQLFEQMAPVLKFYLKTIEAQIDSLFGVEVSYSVFIQEIFGLCVLSSD
ncbi:uncharacterized protein LOC115229326 [Octopus sinensis]|uniref:Uncharacterized protein LOC115229326 n=1 Tax=Octopus sinensis TaxID=2607531 RepID=A0A6P7U3S5_9MOLL|nr:uncharacterized protein LOC115229326 [Octopus sinensis]